MCSSCVRDWYALSYVHVFIRIQISLRTHSPRNEIFAHLSQHALPCSSSFFPFRVVLLLLVQSIFFILKNWLLANAVDSLIHVFSFQTCKNKESFFIRMINTAGPRPNSKSYSNLSNEIFGYTFDGFWRIWRRLSGRSGKFLWLDADMRSNSRRLLFDLGFEFSAFYRKSTAVESSSRNRNSGNIHFIDSTQCWIHFAFLSPNIFIFQSLLRKAKMCRIHKYVEHVQMLFSGTFLKPPLTQHE